MSNFSRKQGLNTFYQKRAVCVPCVGRKNTFRRIELSGQDSYSPEVHNVMQRTNMPRTQGDAKCRESTEKGDFSQRLTLNRGVRKANEERKVILGR